MSQQNTRGTGLQENIAGLLCYVLGWITGIIFLILEPDKKFVRFHAFQSILVSVPFWILSFVFIWVPFLNWLLWVAWVIFMVFLAYQAYQGKKYMAPIAGVYAEKFASGQSGTTNPPAAPPAPPSNPPPANP